MLFCVCFFAVFLHYGGFALYMYLQVTAKFYVDFRLNAANEDVRVVYQAIDVVPNFRHCVTETFVGLLNFGCR